MSGQPRTLDELGEVVRAWVERLGSSFEDPDDDWVPMLFVQVPKGVTIVGLPFSLFGSAEAKDALVVVLRKAMVDLRAFRFALLLNVHAHDLTERADADAVVAANEAGVRLEDMPGAFEQLVLIVGDAEEERCWTTRIQRDEVHPPGLAPWKDESRTAYEGRFAGLGAALREGA